jgi:hypothetical protein
VASRVHQEARHGSRLATREASRQCDGGEGEALPKPVVEISHIPPNQALGESAQNFVKSAGPARFLTSQDVAIGIHWIKAGNINLRTSRAGVQRLSYERFSGTVARHDVGAMVIDV